MNFFKLGKSKRTGEVYLPENIQFISDEPINVYKELYADIVNSNDIDINTIWNNICNNESFVSYAGQCKQFNKETTIAIQDKLKSMTSDDIGYVRNLHINEDGYLVGSLFISDENTLHMLNNNYVIAPRFNIAEFGEKESDKVVSILMFFIRKKDEHDM